ncbi:hypothetical protein ACWKX9_05710 [Enterobacter asburiae]
MKQKFTQTDEKVLAGYFAWLSLVRSLQAQGSLDLDILYQQLNGAENRLSQIGETGAAGHIHSHMDDVKRLMMIAPPMMEKE